MHYKGFGVLSCILKRTSFYRLSKLHGFSFSTLANIHFENLPRRSVLKVYGPEASLYLQGMVTNNMSIFEGNKNKCIYALLLNPQGRVLYDCLVYKTSEEEYLLEHDAAALGFIKVHLDMYRMRKKVKIDPVKEVSVSVALNCGEITDSHENNSSEGLSRFQHDKDVVISAPDPRLGSLGFRFITNKGFDFNGMLAQNEKDVVRYDVLRYKLGVGEGVIDHPPGNCLPFETNIDFLNGVSFNKGCYVGQELTARTHYTGVIRKRLMPVTLIPEQDKYPNFPVECVILNDKRQKVGKLRNHIGKHGLAVLSVEESLKSEELVLDKFDIKLAVSKPRWWPESANAAVA